MKIPSKITPSQTNAEKRVQVLSDLNPFYQGSISYYDEFYLYNNWVNIVLVFFQCE